MRSRTTRVLSLIAAGACACALAASSTAGAAEPAPGAAGPFLPGPPLAGALAPAPPAALRDDLLSARVTRAEATEAVSQAAIDYYTSAFGVSADVARHRLATQGMVPSIGTVLSTLLGPNYTDMWWDNSTGELVVMATSSVPASAIDDALADRNLTREDYRIERVTYTREDLAAADEAAGAELEALVEDGSASVGVASGRVEVTLAASAGDEARARAEGAAQRLSGSTGVPIDVVRSDRESLGGTATLACTTSGYYCDTIIGGAHFYNGARGCTWSYFVGWHGRNPWIPSILTAGHCLNKEPLVSGQWTCSAAGVRCGQVGLSLQYFFGFGRADAGMIDLYARGWLIYGGWWNWGPGYQTPIQGLEWTVPGAGYVVCKNGSTSGSTCGSISQSAVNTTIDGVMQTGLIETTGMTVCHGDSGGPVTSASVPTAVGIVSGSVFAHDGDLCGTNPQYSTPIWQPIYYFNLDWYSGGPYGPYA